MPFGLANAPATYSQLVAKALRHLPSSEVLCYLDDTVIHSADAWSHLRILRKVLAAFRSAGLQISPEKAQLFQDRIKYLGHEVSDRGISIPPEYTSVISDWPIPNTLKTLQAFLGKCGYYRWFIVDYANISAPLVQYTKQDQHEGIPNLHQDPGGGQSLRRHKEQTDVHAHPGLPPSFTASPSSWTRTLALIREPLAVYFLRNKTGQERVIAYWASRLQPCEWNYALTKGELLAVIFFLQYYKYYLLHQPFILQDGQSSTYLDPFTGIPYGHDPPDGWRFLPASTLP